MSSVVLGACSACAASSLYNAGIALQALEARVAPVEIGLHPSLIGRLVRRPRWLAGTGLNILGWPLQALALTLAPIAVVQPSLAFGLILLLYLGHRALGEPVGRREVLALVAIIGGVAGLAAIAPEPSSVHASGPTLALVLGALGAVALAPYVGRALRGHIGGVATGVSGGLALAWSGLSTKFFADAVQGAAWGQALAWGAATGIASGIGLLSEMTALQHRPATQVAPLVFVVQIVVPVTAAPVLTGEDWAHAPLGVPGILAGLFVVIAGAVLLMASPAVRSLVDESATSADTGATPRLRAASRETTRSTPAVDSATDASSSTTRTSPRDSTGSAPRSETSTDT
jgi:hypothetical protein